MIRIIVVLALASIAATNSRNDRNQQWLTREQNRELHSILNGNTDQSKDDLILQLTQFGSSLSQPQQGRFMDALQVVERYQTEMPAGLSAQAQQVVQQMQSVVNDSSLNVGQIRSQTMQILNSSEWNVRQEIWRFIRQQMKSMWMQF